MTYLLDAMVVAFFQRAGREAELAEAATRCQIAIVEEVRAELQNHKSYGGSKFRSWLDSSGIRVWPILLGSPEATLLAHLVGTASAAHNQGERASIALAASNTELTFVTHDKGGMWLALREIWAPGDRILGVPVFLRRLFTTGAITEVEVLDDVMAQVDKAHWPSWWASWRANQTPTTEPPSTEESAAPTGESASVAPVDPAAPVAPDESEQS